MLGGAKPGQLAPTPDGRSPPVTGRTVNPDHPAPAAPPRRTELPLTDHVPRPYDGPPRAEVLALRRQYLTPGLLTYYRDPLLVVEGHMQYLWDETGKRYLDGFAGIVSVSVGHCHPAIVGRVRQQLGTLQ